MKTYPISLIGLASRPAVVIGGGNVAARKVAALLEAAAAVTVISPQLCGDLVALAAAGRVAAVARPYADGDLAGAFLVIAATDDAVVNHAVAAEAERRGLLINVVDDPAHSNFIVPATVRRGEVVAAISTGGGSPALARRLRERLEAEIGPEYGDLAALLAELRPELIARTAPGQPRLAAALRLVDSDLLDVIRRAGLAAARVRALELMANGESANDESRTTHYALRTTQSAIRNPSPVSLVGAGPGDPGLLTLRGAELLRRADVVVYDRLVNEALLGLARPDAELIDVGKEPVVDHPIPQEQINALLVAHARAGKVVVRLKGGDPFVFGRGGEEALALVAAGIPFEIVPGISSAIAVPAYAGIPVTQREVAGSFTVVTGHRADAVGDPAGDWERLAATAGTLVFLMGVANLPRIVAALQRGGRPPATPVAVIARGTLPDQQVVTGTLADIAERAAGLRPPAVIVVGEVVRLREMLRWFDAGRV